MSEVVIGPDVVGLIKAYLDPLVTPAVVSDVPSPRPSVFYRVNAAGGLGFESKALFKARLTLESWAAGNGRLALTNLLLACGHLEAAVAFYAECSGPAYLPDPDSGVPRYVSTVELAAVGSVL